MGELIAWIIAGTLSWNMRSEQGRQRGFSNILSPLDWFCLHPDPVGSPAYFPAPRRPGRPHALRPGLASRLQLPAFIIVMLLTDDPGSSIRSQPKLTM